MTPIPMPDNKALIDFRNTLLKYEAVVGGSDLFNDFVEVYKDLLKTDMKFISEETAKQKLVSILNFIQANRELISYRKNPYKNVYFINNDLVIKLVFIKELLGVENFAIREEWLRRKYVKSFYDQVREKKVDNKVFKITQEDNIRAIVVERDFLKANGFDFAKGLLELF